MGSGTRPVQTQLLLEIYWLSVVGVPIYRSTISIVHGVRVGLMAIYELGGEGFLSNKLLLTSPAHHIRYEFSMM